MKSDLNPVFISEGDDQVELLVIQIQIKELHVRVINAYGQECDSQERKSLFWARLNTEVAEAVEANCVVFIQMDGNLHCGEDIIEGDRSNPHVVDLGTSSSHQSQSHSNLD